jgi:Flp pilus assembly protein TadB
MDILINILAVIGALVVLFVIIVATGMPALYWVAKRRVAKLEAEAAKLETFDTTPPPEAKTPPSP